MAESERRRSQAQAEADARYAKKRAEKHRLPGGYLTAEENQLLEEMAVIYGSKKEAIIKGLEALKNKSKKGG